MAGSYKILQNKEGKYYFNLVADNGEIVLTSELYNHKDGAVNGIESVKRNSPLEERYLRRTISPRQHFFLLKAGNNETIGTSAFYSSVQFMEDAIALVKRLGPARVNQQIDTKTYERKQLTILVVTALEDELDYLKKLSIVNEKPKYLSNNLSYYEGIDNVSGIKTIAVYSLETGLVDTAITTSLAITEWKPEIVAMIGICAGVRDKVNLGDAIIANKCFHYQIGAFTEGTLLFENRSIELNPFINRCSNEIDRNLLNTIYENWTEKELIPKKPINCHIGPMASADLLVRDDNKMLEAVEKDRKTIAVDMESYAFMRACQQHSISYYFVVKGVTDFGNNQKNDDVRMYAKYVSTSIYRVLVDIVIKQKPM